MSAPTRSGLSSHTPPATAPFLDQGFRPFFLLAAAFAALAVPLWIVALRGGLRPGGGLGPMHWHAHEMVFGFTTAVIAGFLLTAIRNWTNRETLRGAPLAALAALWLAGRIAVFFGDRLPQPLTAAIDLAFLPALALICALPLIAANNRRNYAFLAMLGLLAAANASVHFGARERQEALVRSSHFFAIDVVGLMLVVMTGRIIPMFTRNATGRPGVRGNPWLERASVLGMIALLVLDLLPFGVSAEGWLSALLSLVLVARMRFWGSGHTLREPLLWILHAGALWIPVALMLRALSSLGAPVPGSAALHALTTGAIGSLTLGMMARVSLGHTGRKLKAPGSMFFAFGAMVLAGVVRVGGAFLSTTLYFHALEIAALSWSSAFIVFCVAYFRVLTE
jgi:uncharacterized protein involved in response to NO